MYLPYPAQDTCLLSNYRWINILPPNDQCNSLSSRGKKNVNWKRNKVLLAVTWKESFMGYGEYCRLMTTVSKPSQDTATEFPECIDRVAGLWLHSGLTDHKHFYCDWKLLWIFIRKFYAAAFFLFLFLFMFFLVFMTQDMSEGAAVFPVGHSIAVFPSIHRSEFKRLESIIIIIFIIIIISTIIIIIIFSFFKAFGKSRMTYQSLKSSSLDQIFSVFFFSNLIFSYT